MSGLTAERTSVGFHLGTKQLQMGRLAATLKIKIRRLLLTRLMIKKKEKARAARECHTSWPFKRWAELGSWALHLLPPHCPPLLHGHETQGFPFIKCLITL